jgi:hypothetical protein
MGERAYQNDPAITNESRLFRRIHPSQLVWDDETGLARVSSGAFRDLDLSISIEAILTIHELTFEHCLALFQNYKLVSLTAQNGRDNQQIVCSDPTEDEPSHGLIFGTKTSRVRNNLRDASKWIIPPQAPQRADGPND